jgi:serine protease Do
MNWFEKARRQKLLSLTIVFLALAIGILIGTVINTGVRADKGQAVTDATPLVIPSPAQLSNEFSALAKKLEPTVVYITTEYEARQARTPRRPKGGQQPEEEEEDPGNELWRRFFRDPFGGGNPGAQPRMPRQEASGSGFIVDPKGYIITNYHVVDEADKIKVKLHGDSSEYKAKLIGFDEETDLAIIKIDAGRPLTYAKVGNSDSVQVGDWAVAIGSPFGLEASVTAGIVSAKGRDVGAQQFQRFIQTDAAINPGNSGGPLLNIRGEVIGVNTAIATRTGGYQGIGFALPMNVAVRVYNDITKSGRVTRGSIGISWNKAQEKPELLKALGATNGVLVETVQPGGPAEKAGIKPEDIIVSLNGQSIKDGEDLVARISDTPIGQKVRVTVDRDGKKVDYDVTVGDRVEVFKERFARTRPQSVEPGQEATEAKFGIRIRELGSAEREDMKVEAGQGVKVTSILEESFAGEIGIQEGDVIVSINRVPVGSAEDIRKVQTTLKPGDAVAFRVLRENPAAVRRGTNVPRFNSFFVSGTLPRN